MANKINNLKLLCLLGICCSVIIGCAYKKTIKFGPTINKNADMKKSEFDQLVGECDRSENGPKEEGLYFKALDEDYNPALPVDSISNRGKRENF